MLSKGAKPYIPPSERGGPISWASQHDESIAANHSLRFDPYEKPQLPMPSLPSVSSHESDDYTAAKTTYLNNQSTPNLDTISSDVARLRLDGVQKKWGRPTYVSSSSVAHTEADKSGNGSKSDGDRSAEPPAIPESKHTARSKEPEISLEKKKLAASLFGDASKAAGKTTTKNPKPASGAKNTPPKSGLAAPVEKNHVTLPPPPDLLDLNEEVPAVPNVRDPMQDLDGLLDLTTSAASSNSVPVSVQVNTKQTGIDIFSLYETSTLEHAAGVGKNDITVDLMSGIIPGERIESRPSRAAPAANTAAKKGHSVETSMLKDAQSRQVGVNPTSPNPDLFKDLLK
jgi:AP-4 complex subunit epsilon-1